MWRTQEAWARWWHLMWLRPIGLSLDAQRTTSVIFAAADRGSSLGCGTYGNVIRILVPLTASDSIIDEGLEVLRVAIACTSAAGSNAEQVLVQS